jgi:hypothetical protein
VRRRSGQEIILRIERIYKESRYLHRKAKKGIQRIQSESITTLAAKNQKGPDGEQYYIVTDRKGRYILYGEIL